MQARQPLVMVRNGKVVVERDGHASGSPSFPDLRSLALFVAGITHGRQGHGLDPSCLDAGALGVPWLDAARLAVAVAEESARFAAGSGWRVHGTGGDFTFWTDGERYDVTKGGLPGRVLGYTELAWLTDMRGVRRHEYEAAWGPAADVRAVEDGPKSWTAAIRSGGSWMSVEVDGRAAAYGSAAEARAGALAGLSHAVG